MTVGDPKEAICDSVEKIGVKLLVLGSHGKGAFQRYVFHINRTFSIVIILMVMRKQGLPGERQQLLCPPR